MTAARRTPDPLLIELRQLRLMLNMPQHAIAAAADVDESSVSYWECGRRSPHLDKLRPYANAVGFDLALVPVDPDSDAAEALSTRIRAAEADMARTAAERDKLVDVIARLISLPSETVADAYFVRYGSAALDKLTTTEETGRG